MEVGTKSIEGEGEEQRGAAGSLTWIRKLEAGIRRDDISTSGSGLRGQGNGELGAAHCGEIQRGTWVVASPEGDGFVVARGNLDACGEVLDRRTTDAVELPSDGEGCRTGAVGA